MALRSIARTISCRSVPSAAICSQSKLRREHRKLSTRREGPPRSPSDGPSSRKPPMSGFKPPVEEEPEGPESSENPFNFDGPVPMPPGPSPDEADPFDYIFNDYLGRMEPDFQQLLMMHMLLMQSISGKGSLKCSDEFVSAWSVILRRFFQEVPDMRKFSTIIAEEIKLEPTKWDRDIKYLLWTASTMFGSLSRVYMNTSHLLYQVYRTIQEANLGDKPSPTFLNSLKDDTHLPTYQSIAENFGLPFPNPPAEKRAYRTTILTQYFINRKNKGMERVAEAMAPKAKPELRKPPPPDVIDRMSVGETFQLLDFMEVCFHPFNYFCARNGHYLFITKELIDSLADHIERRAQEMKEKGLLASPRRIPMLVEVGAGNGRLSYFLNQRLEGLVSIKPTDWRKWDTETSADVIVMDQKEAVEKLKPDFVLCSFMPSGVDWPSDWRKVKSVKEYILIGETTSGAVGNSWTTFGARRGVDNDPDEADTPPFEEEGWKKTVLDDVSQHVLECYDTLDLYGRACAVSFVRS